MTKDESKIIDWRSTGRRKLRRTLYASRQEYKCEKCSRTSKAPPKDAPSFFEEIWASENRVLDYPLQANHRDKDVTNNDYSNGQWLCAPCHKEEDSKTEKGVSTVEVKRLF